MIADNITLSWIIGGALLDSINPCVFGVLIFLIAFMNNVFKSKKMMLVGGLLYTVVVYLTYLFLGFGILEATVSFGFARGFYLFGATVAIIAGLLEIKDYFWYGRGFSLQMIPGGAKRIKYYTSKLEVLEKSHPILLLFSTAILGVFVVLVELPCTGAPYFAVLGLLAEGSYAQAIPLLLLYNFVFIIPLIIIIAVSYLGTRSDVLEEWRQKHKGSMRLVVGIFLLALGGYMLYIVTLG